MTWTTVRNAGSILDSNSLPKRYDSRRAHSFLLEVVYTFAKMCAEYYDQVGQLPFVYRERQIQSILLPSIAKIADAVFVEQPITRKSKRSLRQGRVDYWVLYQRYVILIELKHSWISFHSGKVRQATTQAWSDALRQIKSISKSEAYDLAIDPEKLLKVAMVIIPCFQSTRTATKLTPIDRSHGLDVFERLTESFYPSPNWSCMWALHRRLQVVHKYLGSRIEIYPYVFITTMIERV